MTVVPDPSDGDPTKDFREAGAPGNAEDVTRVVGAGGAGDRTNATRRETVPGATDATRVETRPGQAPGSEASAGVGWIHVPTVINERYEIVQPLPAGGETVAVQHVRDRRDGSEWVVKLYRGSSRRNVPVMTALKEADHPNVVHVRDFGSERDAHGTDWPWEVLEYVPGGSLGALLRERGACHENDVRAVLTQTAAALHYLHTELRVADRRGAAHRDVKPANILLRGENAAGLGVALADFGLVAETRETRQTHMVAGSWKYQAPETWRRADRRAAQDWWSLGVVVVEMLTGRNPNDGGVGGWSDPEVLFDHLTTHDVDLSGVEDDRWRLLCAGLLTRAPEHRWQYGQVCAWLRGGSPGVHSAPTPRGGKPLRVGGETYDNLADLAEAMADSAWPVARSPFLSPGWLATVRAWLEKEFDGGGIPGELVEHPAQDARAAAVRAAAFRTAVLKGAPPRFAGHHADAAGLTELAASTRAADRRLIAVVSGELLHVFASHPCATPGAPGHRQCGGNCRVLARAAETLPEEEARLAREITALTSRTQATATAGLADTLRGLSHHRELRVLCLRAVLDPASQRRLRWSVQGQRAASRPRACAWWMDLSDRALRDRDSLAPLLLAQVLLPQAKADGLQERRKPDGPRERRRARTKEAVRRAGAHVLRLCSDLLTAALLFCVSLVALYVAVVAWLTWSGDRPATDFHAYATIAAQVQYQLSVPLAAVLLALVVFHRTPAPAAKSAGWLVVGSGVVVAGMLWEGHLRHLRFPYLPGPGFRDFLLELATRPGIREHPGTTASVAAVIGLACLYGIGRWADRRAVRPYGRFSPWATRARTTIVLVVLVALFGPVHDWWPTEVMPAETTELW
ncbi:serine/threonine-protein kinase [Streptomyces sp. NPDC059578]|uniref:serine/threonine-protein kinase n=1 Tax=Streptomyces sp. NPDC059578 TaxID=3346874 RepID=UPI00367759DE